CRAAGEGSSGWSGSRNGETGAPAFAHGGAGPRVWRYRYQARHGAVVRRRDQRRIAGREPIRTLIMLKIDPKYLERVRDAESSDDLFDLVEDAIRLEHATIPPYLTAMLSLHPEKNREIWSIIHSVVVDEMLHMTIACNLLNALGRAPLIDDAGF